jgi:muramoyltetrapeptide carboxypeptidase LdcA involved in peptidoglycan recycling
MAISRPVERHVRDAKMHNGDDLRNGPRICMGYSDAASQSVILQCSNVVGASGSLLSVIRST